MAYIDSLVKQLKTQCFINNGCGFDKQEAHVWWRKQYYGKPTFFKTEWICSKSEMDEPRYTKVVEYLSKLPAGITYTAETKKTKSLPSVINTERYEYEEYTTDFIIHVSDTYSKSIVDSNKGSKIVVLPQFSSLIMSDAEKYKKNIETKHSQIIEPFFDTQIQHYTSSMLRYDGFYDGVSFSYIKMKPLEHGFQLLGMALAFVQYGLKFLKENEFYTIDANESITDISITKHTIKDNNSLSDWN